MSEETTKAKRPSSITLISLFSIYWGVMVFYYIARVGAQNLGLLTMFIAMLGVMFFICGVGFWMMKKWSVVLCVALVVLIQFILLINGSWNVLPLAISVIIVFISYNNLSKKTY